MITPEKIIKKMKDFRIYNRIIYESAEKGGIFMKKILSIISVLVIIICIGSFTANAAVTDKNDDSVTQCSTTCLYRNSTECRRNAECTDKTECTNYTECVRSTAASRNNCSESCAATKKADCPNPENRQKRNEKHNGNNGNGCGSAKRENCAGRCERSGNCHNK